MQFIEASPTMAACPPLIVMATATPFDPLPRRSRVGCDSRGLQKIQIDGLDRRTSRLLCARPIDASLGNLEYIL